MKVDAIKKKKTSQVKNELEFEQSHTLLKKGGPVISRPCSHSLRRSISNIRDFPQVRTQPQVGPLVPRPCSPHARHFLSSVDPCRLCTGPFGYCGPLSFLSLGLWCTLVSVSATIATFLTQQLMTGLVHADALHVTCPK